MPIAVGRILEFALGTSWGQDAAARLGNPSLATDEGRRLVRQYSAGAAAAALTLAVALGQGRGGTRDRRPDRVETTGYMSELLLAAGALLKVASEFMRDRRKLEQKTAFHS